MISETLVIYNNAKEDYNLRMLNFIPKRYEAFALNFANTFDPYVEPNDALQDAEALQTFLTKQGYKPPKANLLALGRALIDARDLLRKVASVKSDQRGLELLYPLIQEAKWQLSLNQKTTDDLELVVDTHSLKADVIQSAALGMISLLCAHGVSRIRHCKASPCEELFCDRSKSGRQAFCCKRCSNRYGVYQYRLRQ